MSSRRLWAPWRMGYLRRSRSTSFTRRCIFCEKGRSRADTRNLVLMRGRHGFCLLNLFPYSNGHLMAAPYRHVGDLDALRPEEWLELHELARNAIGRLRRVLRPDGFNVGLNLGRAAGSGVPGHLHLHVVPRWIGDHNFMPIFSDTRILSQSLESAYRLLRRASPSRA